MSVKLIYIITHRTCRLQSRIKKMVREIHSVLIIISEIITITVYMYYNIISITRMLLFYWPLHADFIITVLNRKAANRNVMSKHFSRKLVLLVNVISFDCVLLVTQRGRGEVLMERFFVICREIIDNTGKENGIDIVMPERTYHLIAESAEDARCVFRQ